MTPPTRLLTSHSPPHHKLGGSLGLDAIERWAIEDWTLLTICVIEGGFIGFIGFESLEESFWCEEGYLRGEGSASFIFTLCFG